MKSFLATKQSLLIAMGLIVALTVWLLSGQFGADDSRTGSTTAVEELRELLVTVRVRSPEPRRISREIVFSGRTEPARAVTLRAETGGRVITLGAERGAEVKEGDVIARLDMRDRRARLEEARALVAQRELEFKGAERLLSQKFQSEIHLAGAQTNLAAARSLVKRIQQEIDDTKLYAPFDGVLVERPVEFGTFVAVGDKVARILDQDPMLLTGTVTQQEVRRLVLGDRGTAKLVTGQRVEGEVRYIASEADPATRTFRIEMAVPNPIGALLSGVSAEIHIPLGSVTAYHVSPALLSLNEADELGIMAVNSQNVVQFQSIRIVRATADGLWVTGIPNDVRIITVGQGFVHDGERVNAVPEGEVAAADRAPDSLATP
ncbi:MAG: efflux RND transporter periplasmic adaptor subunit [Gammaproteobacteria bacterium]|nr:efflux RND transporter periplasmic adaptor subunit [Gammaproteobacteria bacterium]